MNITIGTLVGILAYVSLQEVEARKVKNQKPTDMAAETGDFFQQDHIFNDARQGTKLSYENLIPSHLSSSNFSDCINDIFRHLRAQDQNVVILCSQTSHPFIEHFSFELFNKLFFVMVEDQKQDLEIPTQNINSLILFAKEANAIACIMPVKKVLYDDGKTLWTPENKGFGLLNAENSSTIDRGHLVNVELIEISDWELHMLSIDIILRRLEQEGKEVRHYHYYPQCYPHIWLESKKGKEWVLVGASRHPDEAKKISDIYPKNEFLFGVPRTIFSIVVAHIDDPFDPLAKQMKKLGKSHAADSGFYLPLYRRYKGKRSTFTAKFETVKSFTALDFMKGSQVSPNYTKKD